MIQGWQHPTGRQAIQHHNKLISMMYNVHQTCASHLPRPVSRCEKKVRMSPAPAEAPRARLCILPPPPLAPLPLPLLCEGSCLRFEPAPPSCDNSSCTWHRSSRC